MENIKSRILYEDNHLIIVNKLAGEIVQGDDTQDEPLLEKVRSYIRLTYEKQGNVFCGLVHRLDRPVSGAVIFAKTSKALSRMNELIKMRRISKIYWAVVEGIPAETSQKLTNYLKKNERLNKSFVVDAQAPGAQQAVLSYNLLAHSQRYSVLEIELFTGRHHQIRAQLAANGTIIKGDLKYGAKRSNSDGSICLHARKIEFEHPVSHTLIHVVAEPANPLFNDILRG